MAPIILYPEFIIQKLRFSTEKIKCKKVDLFQIVSVQESVVNVEFMHSDKHFHPFDQLISYFESQIKFRFDAKEEEYAKSTGFQAKFSELFSISHSRKSCNQEEIFLLILTLIPHVDPLFLDQIFAELLGDGNHPQIGGVRGKQHRGIIPTGEMALFLLAGEDLLLRQQYYQEFFTGKHWLFRENILLLEAAPPGEPPLSGKLTMTPEYVQLFLTGEMGRPDFGINFPAQRISTRQEWEDLILNPLTREQVQDLLDWLTHHKTVLEEWGMEKQVKPGYRALFYGPSGTGKTLTASLLGKVSQRDVYRVDLSMVVSKYIGETEKNLSKLFDKAEHKGWILFFDEADALFGKRTGVRDAHDRYANQEVSYLLQRVEDYDGLVILASNLRDNIDDAFLRRFQAIIHFPLPRSSDRLQLWQNALPSHLIYDQTINLAQIADKYELSGADIVNIAYYCSLKARAEKRSELTEKYLLAGIQRELRKLGKRSI